MQIFWSLQRWIWTAPSVRFSHRVHPHQAMRSTSIIQTRRGRGTTGPCLKIRICREQQSGWRRGRLRTAGVTILPPSGVSIWANGSMTMKLWSMHLIRRSTVVRQCLKARWSSLSSEWTLALWTPRPSWFLDFRMSLQRFMWYMRRKRQDLLRRILHGGSTS